MRVWLLLLTAVALMSAAEPIRVLVDGQDARAGGLFVAMDHDLPAQHGLRIEIIERGQGQRAAAALAVGEVDAALMSDALFTAWAAGSRDILLATTHAANARSVLVREDGHITGWKDLRPIESARLPMWGDGVPAAVIMATRPLGIDPSLWSGYPLRAGGVQAFIAGELVAWPATWRDRAQFNDLGIRTRALPVEPLGFGVGLVIARSSWNADHSLGLRLRDVVLEGWQLARNQPAVLLTALTARAPGMSNAVLLQEAEAALSTLDPTPLPDLNELHEIAAALIAAGIPAVVPEGAIGERVNGVSGIGSSLAMWFIPIGIALLIVVMRKKREQRKAVGEASKARATQRHMLSDLPDLEGWEIGVHFRPHAEVSGDFYLCSTMADSRALIVVGDVSGHGVQAAIVASAVHKAGELLAPQHASLRGWMTALDETIAPDLPRGLFVTMVAIALDPWSGALECIRAGHPPAYLIEDGGAQSWTEIGPIGMALGLGTRSAFAEQVRSESHHLRPGGDLLLFTDGLTEIFDRSGLEYGVEGLQSSVNRHRAQVAQDFVDHIAEDAIAHGKHGPDDDLTALVIRRVRATVSPGVIA